MRVVCPIAAVVFAAVLAGCGADDEAPPRPLERVRLQVTAPADGTTVRERTSDVRGRVSPRSADVEVLGRPALVSDGRFTAVVPLEPGVNVIDVIATAPRRSPALTALRVTRDVLVSVPRLAGVPQGELERRLERLDLRLDVDRGGGLLDFLYSGERTVCEQEPAAGTRVRRGSTVRVIVAKRC